MTYFFVLGPLVGLVMFFFALRTPLARKWPRESERAFLFAD